MWASSAGGTIFVHKSCLGFKPYQSQEDGFPTKLCIGTVSPSIPMLSHSLFTTV
jgi:hypothetical protein